ncbi:MAG TPA: ubiquinone/menaquinone biosynthesis methyltransferase [Aggregatilineales bacterium]|nr:ubiquinone/menaquinone biosynthesis methyltransferase [Aggregatilineales bacterium]
MATLEGRERAAYVRRMFGRIAHRYDLMNRLMTFGQDLRWRRYVVRQAALPPGGRLLDVATGTGDIALEALSQQPGTEAAGLDFSPEMMVVGRTRDGGEQVRWVNGDALALPFPDASFDAVTSGYLMRNVIDVAGAFREQVRVVRPGGRVVCLDSSPPPRGPLRPLIMLHLNVVIPLMGRLIAGDASAYTYLPESTAAFKTPGELALIMQKAGLTNVRYRRFMFGTMAVHTGTRPEEPR